MMTPPVKKDSATLHFLWQGASSWGGGWSKGGLEVKVVDLIFKNSQREISVHIPENLSAERSTQLLFTCRKYDEREFGGDRVRHLIHEGQVFALRVTAENISSLVVQAGIFEEGEDQGPAIMDQQGNITRQKRVFRTNQTIEIDMPDVPEAGQAYTLIVTAFPFSARILKQEETGLRLIQQIRRDAKITHAERERKGIRSDVSPASLFNQSYEEQEGVDKCKAQ